MTEITTINHADVDGDPALVPFLNRMEALPSLTTQELRQELSKTLGITAKTLAYLAAIWQELERRGEDLSDLRQGLGFYLPAIANGRLLPDLVVQYAGQKMLLEAMARVPIEQQESILAKDSVMIVAFDEENGWQEESIPLRRLRSTDCNLVFGDFGIRTIDEQREIINDRLRKRRRRQDQHKKYRAYSPASDLSWDRETESLIVNGAAVSHDRLLEILNDVYGFDVAERLGEPAFAASDIVRERRSRAEDMKQRNAAIVRLYHEGVSPVALASRYQIKPARVYQILSTAKD